MGTKKNRKEESSTPVTRMMVKKRITIIKAKTTIIRLYELYPVDISITADVSISG